MFFYVFYSKINVFNIYALRQKTISSDISGCGNVLGHARSTFTVINRTAENSVRYKSEVEVETILETGSTYNLTTETDIDAI